MSLGNVALGMASLVMGAHHLRKAAQELSGGRGLSGIDQREAMPAPRGRGVPVPGRAFHNSGRRAVQTRNGGAVPMRLRSYHIRTLGDRIRYLERLADEGKRDPEVYAFARRALSRKCGGKWCVPEKDNVKEARVIFGEIRRRVPPRQTAADVATARNLFRNLRKNVRYTSDIMGVDTYQKPGHTLALGTADCDDYSSLTCASLLSVGIPCRYKVIRTKGAQEWNHIYAQAGFPRANPTQWISMDSSVSMPFGWEAPKRMVAASRVFRVR
jgi:transglutaminase-like putative cysteine protease